jgi:Mn2+/Fe2+ NRAMP family transporter
VTAGHIAVTLADGAARARVPFVGPYAKVVFAVGLYGASTLAAAVLPLATMAEPVHESRHLRCASGQALACGETMPALGWLG